MTEMTEGKQRIEEWYDEVESALRDDLKAIQEMRERCADAGNSAMYSGDVSAALERTGCRLVRIAGELPAGAPAIGLPASGRYEREPREVSKPEFDDVFNTTPAARARTVLQAIYNSVSVSRYLMDDFENSSSGIVWKTIPEEEGRPLSDIYGPVFDALESLERFMTKHKATFQHPRRFNHIW